MFYNTEDGKTRVQVLLDSQTCWLPQSLSANFFFSHDTTTSCNNSSDSLFPGQVDWSLDVSKHTGCADAKYHIETLLKLGLDVLDTRAIDQLSEQHDIGR